MIVNFEDRVLLEKRPSVGIWGGLWSLPEINADCPESEIYYSMEKNYGLVVRDAQAEKPFRHTFSHFHLMIEPWCLKVDVKVSKVAESNTEWVEINHLESFGMPRPVEQLLLNILK